MLTRLDHLVLLTRDFHSAVQDYKILFGFKPDEIADQHGFQTALFRTGNIGLEIMAPLSEAALSRTDEILANSSSKLTSLAFGTPISLKLIEFWDAVVESLARYYRPFAYPILSARV